MIQAEKQRYFSISSGSAAAGLMVLIFIMVFSDVRGEDGTDAQKKIELPAPRLDGPVSLEKALARRRSIRQFTGEPLSPEQISQLAWSGQGITEKTRGFRTAPSAGAIYPIELYMAIPQGLYVYKPDKHSLEMVAASDMRSNLSKACLGQSQVATAGCDIIIAGSERKLAARYRDKARLFLLLEAGHIAQNILLQTVTLDLGAVPIGAFDTDEVKKICTLPGDLEALYIISIGHPEGQQTEQKVEEKAGSIKMESKKVKKAVLIIASRNFRDEELFETKKVIENAGIGTVTASSKTGTITGMKGGKAEVTVLLKDVNVGDYDAVVFIGGIGAQEYFNDRTAQSIAKIAADKKKVLAAICIAPSILANAGLLNGVSATSFVSERVNLTAKGAKFTGADVQQDGLIITGDGPAAAKKFGETIVRALEKQQ